METGQGAGGRGRLSLRRAAPLIVLLGLAVAALWAFGERLNFETLRQNRATLLAWRDANPLLAAGGYVLAYVLVVVLSLPGAAVMTVTGGFLFGPVAGAALAVVGATCGATLIFLLAKRGLGDALYARLSAMASDSMLKRLERGFRQDELNYLLMIRLVPAFPFFVVNLAPAFLGVRLRSYVIATGLGIIPGTAVYAWVGSGLGAVFARGETPDLTILFDPVILGPILGLAVLSLLPVVIRRFGRQRAAR